MMSYYYGVISWELPQVSDGKAPNESEAVNSVYVVSYPVRCLNFDTDQVPVSPSGGILCPTVIYRPVLIMSLKSSWEMTSSSSL